MAEEEPKGSGGVPPDSEGLKNDQTLQDEMRKVGQDFWSDDPDKVEHAQEVRERYLGEVERLFTEFKGTLEEEETLAPKNWKEYLEVWSKFEKYIQTQPLLGPKAAISYFDLGYRFVIETAVTGDRSLSLEDRDTLYGFLLDMAPPHAGGDFDYFHDRIDKEPELLRALIDKLGGEEKAIETFKKLHKRGVKQKYIAYPDQLRIVQKANYEQGQKCWNLGSSEAQQQLGQDYLTTRGQFIPSDATYNFGLPTVMGQILEKFVGSYSEEETRLRSEAEKELVKEARSCFGPRFLGLLGKID